MAAGCLMAAGILFACPKAAASPDSAVPGTGASTGGTVVIRAVIRPVHIVVVDNSGTVTQILSNGPSDVTPSVHRNSSAGKAIELTGAIHDQYESIMRRTDQSKTGVIYEKPTAGRSAGIPGSSLISILFTRPFAAL